MVCWKGCVGLRFGRVIGLLLACSGPCGVRGAGRDGDARPFYWTGFGHASRVGIPRVGIPAVKIVHDKPRSKIGQDALQRKPLTENLVRSML